MIMDSLIIILFVSLLTSQQALGQNVETRGTNDKVSVNGGQARTVYSQRQLSPHRMMHFGKRPMNTPPPTILTPQVLDLYNPGQLSARYRPDRYPYLFSIELERGQTLQAVPEELSSSSYEENPESKNLMYNFDRQPEYIVYNPDARQRQQQTLGEQKLARLLSSDSAASQGSDNDDERTKQSSSSDTQDDNQQSLQPVRQTFSVSTRSMQSRTNTLSKPKVYVSNLLYGGRPVSSMMPSIDTFNKKADRGENLFMHFGRK